MDRIAEERIAELWRELYERNPKGCIQKLLNLDPGQAKMAKYGFSLLHNAAGSGDLDEVVLLLDHNSDVNLVDAEGDTALHRAAVHSDPRICRILLPTFRILFWAIFCNYCWHARSVDSVGVTSHAQ